MKKFANVLVLLSLGVGLSACGSKEITIEKDEHGLLSCQGTGSGCYEDTYVECKDDIIMKEEWESEQCATEKVDHKLSDIPGIRASALAACDTIGTSACDGDFYNITVESCKADVPDIEVKYEACANAAYDYYECLTKKFCGLKSTSCMSQESSLKTCIADAFEATFPTHLQINCDVNMNGGEKCDVACQGDGQRCTMGAVFSYLITCENNTVVSKHTCKGPNFYNNCAENQLECKGN